MNYRDACEVGANSCRVRRIVRRVSINRKSGPCNHCGCSDDYLSEAECDLIELPAFIDALQTDEVLLAFARSYMNALGTHEQRLAHARSAYEAVLDAD